MHVNVFGRKSFPVLALAVLPVLGSPALAAVSFNMLTIGNPGNAADTRVNTDGTSGYGSVGYNFAIASTSVTNAQYVEFLNKVDPNGTNALQLYESRMSSWPYNPSTGVGGTSYEGGVLLNSSAAAGSKYSARTGRESYPAMFVTWASSARFVNWLANGQGTGGTESGVYTAPPLSTSGSWAPAAQPARADNAQFFLPSENEYYKAAYYDPTLNGGAGGYYQYGTRSNTAPTSGGPGTGTNVANVRNVNGTYWQTGRVFDANYGDYQVPVGSYPNAKSYYGLLDADGGVYNWTETFKPVAGKLFPIYKGGAFYYDATHAGADQRFIYSFANVQSYSWFGFRVAGAVSLTISLTASDAAGDSSFGSGLNWSNATAPNASGQYAVASGLTLRTASDGGSFAFAGSQLTIGDNGASNGTLLLKNATGSTVTVNNLVLNKGSVSNGGTSTGSTTSVTLAGSGVTLGTGGGTFDSGQAGRTLTVTSPISGNGTLKVTGGGTVVLTAANTYTGLTTVSAGTLRTDTDASTTAILTATSGVDLTSSAKLQLAYTSSNPLATIKSILTAGYGQATKFSNGQLRASALAAGQTLGYGDAGGVITVRVTLPGDADLNGAVDFNDFLVLQNNFANPNTTFAQGNFNYDAATDFNDFLQLQNNFGTSISGAAVPVTAAQIAALTAFGQTIPEPSSVGLILLAAAGIHRRRRPMR